MTFNSWIFIVFFAAVYGLYWALKSSWRAQNFMLLLASILFYGWWDWRYLSLLAVSVGTCYWTGLIVCRSQDRRRRLHAMQVCIGVNLLILGFFKYFNFFSESLHQMLTSFGLQVNPFTLQVLLPVGISFYTFQALSYVVDVYRREMPAERSLSDLSLYILFFPQLVAGPIERATHLLPQFKKPRVMRLDEFQAGLFLVLWGFYKKIVIADNVATVSSRIFNNYTQYQGLDLVLGTLAFSVQIYCDFSAYSDIARGVSKWMGFDLMLNFRLPYFATSPSDFWRRWHISLSTWLRDYLYIPLGGNRGSALRTDINLFLTMLLGGLWHGAAWNFIIWGVFHGTLLIVYRHFERKKGGASRTIPAWRLTVQILIMFFFTNIGWVLFRCGSAAQIAHFLTQTSLRPSSESAGFAYSLFYFSAPLILLQWFQAKRQDLLVYLRLPPVLQGAGYALMILMMIVFGVREVTEFIYFQF